MESIIGSGFDDLAGRSRERNMAVSRHVPCVLIHRRLAVVAQLLSRRIVHGSAYGTTVYYWLTAVTFV
jgi:hypothetical protein